MSDSVDPSCDDPTLSMGKQAKHLKKASMAARVASCNPVSSLDMRCSNPCALSQGAPCAQTPINVAYSSSVRSN